MICSPIYTIMIGFTCLRVFDLVNLKHDGRMMILRPYRPKKIEKMAQRPPTGINRD